MAYSKLFLFMSYGKLLNLIHEYNVYLMNLNNKFGLSCDIEFIEKVEFILSDTSLNYDYDYYTSLIDKDIEIIHSLIDSKQLVSNKLFNRGLI